MRMGTAIASLMLASLLAAACPAAALADVRDSDIVVGKTVQERGLSPFESPDITAENALLVSSEGEVFFARDADEPVRIASITKVMTAIVALENAPLDAVVTVDNDAATVGESSAGLLEGDSMDLETALYALMIPSGNDAAIAIAKSVGALLAGVDASDSVAYDTFVAAMNAKAEELGCADTLFTNPHGLDEDEYESDAHSTASDVGIMVAAAMEDETFRAVVDAGDTSIQVTAANGLARPVNLVSTDELIGVYEGICGVKTGTTNYAGFCFAGAASREAGEYYSVVLGAPSSEERFSDTVELLDWVYDGFVDVPLINADSFVDSEGDTVSLVAEIAHNDWVDATVAATVADPALTARVFFAQGSVTQEVTMDELSGDIEEGDVVGRIVFSQDGVTIAECDLVAAESQRAPNFFEEIGVAVDRFIRDMQNQPTVAQSVCFNSPEPLGDR